MTATGWAILVAVVVVAFAALAAWNTLHTRRLVLRRMEQLKRHGLSDRDAETFMSTVRAGREPPKWLADRVIAAAGRAREAGEPPPWR
jgi:hypothetical protein